MAVLALDHLDRLAAEAFDGYIVRKDLVQKFARQYPVPTYVCEFLLGRYGASIDADEIQEGLQIVERQLRDRAVRSGEEELFKARARERGSVKLIDMLSARLDARTDSYLATLPSLQLKDVSIADTLVRDNERSNCLDCQLVHALSCQDAMRLLSTRVPRREGENASRSQRCLTDVHVPWTVYTRSR